MTSYYRIDYITTDYPNWEPLCYETKIKTVEEARELLKWLKEACTFYRNNQRKYLIVHVTENAVDAMNSPQIEENNTRLITI